MFNALSQGLIGAIKKVFGPQKLTESNIDEALAEVRTALLAADVHYKVAKGIVERVRAECVGQKVIESVSPGQQVIKLVNDELTKVLGGATVPLSTAVPLKILLCGLQGSGKTTTAAKLALKLKSEGRSVTLVACDLQRPAAVEQLRILATQVGVEFYSLAGETKAITVAKRALAEVKSQVIIFDTAGRLQVDPQLMEELQQVSQVVAPEEKWLVIDAALGQQSVAVAGGFQAAVGLNGLILAKVDGDARGGAALSIRELTGIPIRYLGVGEKVEDLELLYPERLAGRILGMGDVVSLVEHAQSKIDQTEAAEMTERMMAADFSFDDMLKQMQQVKKMGDMGKLVKMIPGMSNIEIGNEEQKKMGRSEAIILSMTPHERRNPSLINGTRTLRIAKGAGVQIKEVNAMIKQLNQMRDMMKMMRGGKGKEMMKRMEAMQGKKS